MKMLIVSGTDINHRASGSGVVLKQILCGFPSNIDLHLLNLGETYKYNGVTVNSSKPKKKSRFWQKIIPIMTFTSLMYSRYLADKNIIKLIADLHGKEKFDHIFYHDTIAMQHYVKIKNSTQSCHLIDLHSLSYKYYLNSTDNIFRKIFYYREMVACKYEERTLSSKYEKCYLVNKGEAHFANSCYRTNKFIGVPLGADLNTNIQDIETVATKVNIVYIGNLSYKANLDGLMNFIDSYFESLFNNASYFLHIVGPSPEGIVLPADNIKIYGFVENLEEFMSNMDFGVATMVNGSGMKNKIFDYLRFGIPAIINEYTALNNTIDSKYIYAVSEGGLVEALESIPYTLQSKVKESIAHYDQRLVSKEFWLNMLGEEYES